MVTFRYKGYYIHENFSDDKIKVQTPNNEFYKCKSVRAAKIIITRMINRGGK